MHSRFHPSVEFLYLMALLCFSVLYLHPFCLAISLSFGLLNMILLMRKKMLLGMLFAAALCAVINPLFQHAGVTILWYFPDGNPLTAESILFGIAAAVMLMGALCHCSLLSRVLDSEKLGYLFGRISPALSLVFSMSLRFAPRFSEQLTRAKYAREGLLGEKKSGRCKEAVRLLSGMISRSLEDSLETADSMKCRGYGIGKRTAYSNFRFERRDGAAMVFLVLLIGYLGIGGALGGFRFSYFPQISPFCANAYQISLFCADTIFFAIPILSEGWEVLRWKRLQSKI